MRYGLAILLFASCASGARPILRGGYFASHYTPPVGHNQVRDPSFVVTVEHIDNGEGATNFFAQITVRNVSKEVATFDPADIELFVPETGMTYQHITKNRSSVTVPVGFDLISATTIKPGQMIVGSLWFQTPPHEAAAKTLQLNYRDGRLDFPPIIEPVNN